MYLVAPRFKPRSPIFSSHSLTAAARRARKEQRAGRETILSCTDKGKGFAKRLYSHDRCNRSRWHYSEACSNGAACLSDVLFPVHPDSRTKRCAKCYQSTRTADPDFMRRIGAIGNAKRLENKCISTSHQSPSQSEPSGSS